MYYQSPFGIVVHYRGYVSVVLNYFIRGLVNLSDVHQVTKNRKKAFPLKGAVNTVEIFELRNGCYTGMQQLSYVVVSPRPQCLLSYNKTQTSSLHGLWCMPCIRVTLEDIITQIYLFPRYLSSKNTGLIFYFYFIYRYTGSIKIGLSPSVFVLLPHIPSFLYSVT